MRHKILQVFALGSSWLCHEAYCMRFFVVRLLCSFLTEGIHFTFAGVEASFLRYEVCITNKNGMHVILPIMECLFCKRVESHPGYEVSVLQVG